MALCTMKAILSESIENRYAVGGFDTMDHLITEAILSAAEEKNVPVIVMVPDFIFGRENIDLFFRYLVDRCQTSSVPVALHLDHGTSYDSVVQAIRYGFTSVMFDGSKLPIEENISITRKVCEVAHACGVTTEGEIGHVGGHEGNSTSGNEADRSKFSKPEEAIRFVSETGVDALAIAIGTVHGVFKGEPKLDFERLKEIRASVSIPLVMHGGSGLSPADFKKAIKNGINKINFFTGISLGAGDAVRTLVQNSPGRLAIGDVTEAAFKKVSEIVGEQIEIFGTKPLISKPGNRF